MGEEMKMLLSFSMLCTLISPINQSGIEIKIKEGSYCVMNMHDNNVLESFNPSHTQSVASISKIMTSIVAIEEGNINDFVQVNDSIDGVDGSMLYLQKGDVFLLKDLLYGLMLRSGNDAAALIADHVSGREEDFVKAMNVKAKEIGMNATKFKNPSGLDEKDGGNISSSCDMALLMSYAMRNSTFREIVATRAYSPRKGILWKNKNRFLFDYPYATGGKTGYTKQAKRTLVTTSKQNNMEVVVVSLNIDDDFKNHETLHEWSYDHFKEVTILKKGKYSYKNQSINVKTPFVQSVEKKSDAKVKVKSTWSDKFFTITSTYNNFKNQKKYEVNYE